MPISKIIPILDFRFDILLRTHVLLNRDRQAWESWDRALKEYGFSPVVHTYEGFLSLYRDIRKNGIRIPVVLQKINEGYYLEDGAHRFSIALALKETTIDALVVKKFGNPSVFLESSREVSVPWSINKDKANSLMRSGELFKYIPPSDIKKILNLQLTIENQYAQGDEYEH